MALDPSRGPILDATGRPTRPNEPRSHLDPAMEALVQTELNSAIDHLREWNRHDLDAIKRDVARKWRWLTGGLAALNIILGLSLVTVLQWVPRYTRAQLLEPKVNATIDHIITTKS